MLTKGRHSRDEKWTESIAVGSEPFVTTTKEKLELTAKGREVIGGNGSFELRESSVPYKAILWHEDAVVRFQNECCWEDIGCTSTGGGFPAVREVGSAIRCPARGCKENAVAA